MGVNFTKKWLFQKVEKIHRKLLSLKLKILSICLVKLEVENFEHLRQILELIKNKIAGFGIANSNIHEKYNVTGMDGRAGLRFVSIAVKLKKWRDFLNSSF